MPSSKQKRKIWPYKNRPGHCITHEKIQLLLNIRNGDGSLWPPWYNRSMIGFNHTGADHRKNRLTQTYPINSLRRGFTCLIISWQVNLTRSSNMIPGMCKQKNHNAPLLSVDTSKPRSMSKWIIPDVKNMIVSRSVLENGPRGTRRTLKSINPHLM